MSFELPKCILFAVWALRWLTIKPLPILMSMWPNWPNRSGDWLADDLRPSPWLCMLRTPPRTDELKLPPPMTLEDADVF